MRRLLTALLILCTACQHHHHGGGKPEADYISVEDRTLGDLGTGHLHRQQGDDTGVLLHIDPDVDAQCNAAALDKGLVIGYNNLATGNATVWNKANTKMDFQTGSQFTFKSNATDVFHLDQNGNAVLGGGATASSVATAQRRLVLQEDPDDVPSATGGTVELYADAVNSGYTPSRLKVLDEVGTPMAVGSGIFAFAGNGPAANPTAEVNNWADESQLTLLYSIAIPAKTLAKNGDSLEFHIVGTFPNAATASTKRIRIMFASAATGWNTGSPIFTLPCDINEEYTTNWEARGTIVRTGAMTQRASVTLSVSMSASSGFLQVYSEPDQTLANVLYLNVFGGGTGQGDVAGKFIHVRKDLAP